MQPVQLQQETTVQEFTKAMEFPVTQIHASHQLELVVTEKTVPLQLRQIVVERIKAILQIVTLIRVRLQRLEPVVWTGLVWMGWMNFHALGLEELGMVDTSVLSVCRGVVK
jgi:hypothetical protein